MLPVQLSSLTAVGSSLERCSQSFLRSKWLSARWPGAAVSLDNLAL